MTHLQPAQYASWLRKAHDPDWTEHRYRTALDRAMVSAILDLEAAREEIATLSRVVDQDFDDFHEMLECDAVSLHYQENVREAIQRHEKLRMDKMVAMARVKK
jgi:hypothetical protein